MDTMTLTKVTAGLCGAFLVFLLGKWAAEGIYHMDSHGEASYVIEVASTEPAGGGEEIDLAALLAEADIGKGAKVYKKCAACHSADPEKRKPGPHLQAISGRAAGAVEGFRYSSPLLNCRLLWMYSIEAAKLALWKPLFRQE